MRERLTGDEVREIRTRIGLRETDFALLLGVTVRSVELWEAGVIVPSVLMSMVIRAEAAKHARRSRAAEEQPSLGRRIPLVSRPRRARGNASRRFVR